MGSDRERLRRKVDRALDRYGDDVGWDDVEMFLQRRAQDAREQAIESGDGDPILFEDIQGYADTEDSDE